MKPFSNYLVSTTYPLLGRGLDMRVLMTSLFRLHLHPASLKNVIGERLPSLSFEELQRFAPMTAMGRKPQSRVV